MNWFKEKLMRRKMKIEETEVICDKCEGEGYQMFGGPAYRSRIMCRKCDGKGKLDWVTNIVGKPKSSHSTIDYITINNSSNTTDFGNLLFDANFQIRKAFRVHTTKLGS